MWLLMYAEMPNVWHLMSGSIAYSAVDGYSLYVGTKVVAAGTC